MCSICGFWNLDFSPVVTDDIHRFSSALKHRGPDGVGVHIDAAACLALANNRLAIIDPTHSGSQPIPYAQDRYWITFNGEIYNHIELRNELKGIGFQFQTSTDTEILLAAYVHWGEACQLKLNGMWACAIWDSQERRLFLSRDRFGIKPLYYSTDSSRFSFASEVKAFLALNKFKRSTNLPYLATSISTHKYLFATPHTILQDVKRLEAGHCLTITQNRPPVLKRWWNTLDHVEAAPKRFKDQVDTFQNLFNDACRIRMQTTLPVGVSLSGGMDSTSVLATMHNLADTEKSLNNDTHDSDFLRAYVATFSNKMIDESPAANLLIKKLGVSACFEQVNSLFTGSDLDQMLFHVEDINSVHLANWSIYQAMHRDGVKIGMTGDGSDELFVAYPPHLDAALAETLHFPPRLYRYFQLKKLIRSMSAGQNVPKAKWSYSAPGKEKSLIDGSELLMINNLDDDYSRFAEDIKKIPGKGLLARRLYFDFHYGILPWILHLKDMISMAHGVEIRSPFMDWRIICFAYSLPGTSLINSRATKRILREAMQNKLPKSILQSNSKSSFVNHEGSAFWQMRDLVLDTVHSKAFLTSPLWPGKRMQQLIEKTYRDRDNRYIDFFWRCIKATRLQEIFK